MKKDKKEKKSGAPQSLSAVAKKDNAEKKVEPKGKKSDPICSSAGWCGEPWPESMKDKREIVEYRTGLPLDKDIQNTQSNIKD